MPPDPPGCYIVVVMPPPPISSVTMIIPRKFCSIARTQSMPGHSIGTLHLWELLQKTWGSGACSHRTFWKFWESQVVILGHTVTFRQYGSVRGVKSLLHYLRQTCIQWDMGSAEDVIILWIQIAILHCQDILQRSIRNRQHYNNLQLHLHLWTTAWQPLYSC